MKETLLGRLFIKAYYALNPQVTYYLAESGQLNGWVRSGLDWLVERLDSSE